MTAQTFQQSMPQATGSRANAPSPGLLDSVLTSTNRSNDRVCMMVDAVTAAADKIFGTTPPIQNGMIDQNGLINQKALASLDGSLATALITAQDRLDASLTRLGNQIERLRAL
jgi:hypothetical protein